MKLLLVLAALVAFLAACAAPAGEDPGWPPVSELPHPAECGRTFVVSSDFPDAERAALQRAAIRWNAIAIEKFCLRQAAEGEKPEDMIHGVFRIKYKGEYWQQLSESNGGADILGVHFSDGDRIGIIDDLSNANFELVALHEFGHAHGLVHIEAPAIMHASLGTADDFTPNDLAECRRVGACLKEDEDG